ncbi:MAG: hypothetical protein KBD55_00265 [Candidatus Pacebacteria bacterium]|nr:hypothetical protein [Candidatus Paceibacterota bacterium]
MRSPRPGEMILDEVTTCASLLEACRWAEMNFPQGGTLWHGDTAVLCVPQMKFEAVNTQGAAS